MREPIFNFGSFIGMWTDDQLTLITMISGNNEDLGNYRRCLRYSSPRSPWLNRWPMDCGDFSFLAAPAPKGMAL